MKYYEQSLDVKRMKIGGKMPTNYDDITINGTKLNQCSDCLTFLQQSYYMYEYMCAICEKDLFKELVGDVKIYRKHIKVKDKNICELCLKIIQKKKKPS